MESTTAHAAKKQKKKEGGLFCKDWVCIREIGEWKEDSMFHCFMFS